MRKKGPPFNGRTFYQAQTHHLPQLAIPDLALQLSNVHLCLPPTLLWRNDQSAGLRGRWWSKTPSTARVITNKQAPTLSFYPNGLRGKNNFNCGNVVSQEA